MCDCDWLDLNLDSNWDKMTISLPFTVEEFKEAVFNIIADGALVSGPNVLCYRP